MDTTKKQKEKKADKPKKPVYYAPTCDPNWTGSSPSWAVNLFRVEIRNGDMATTSTGDWEYALIGGSNVGSAQTDWNVDAVLDVTSKSFSLDVNKGTPHSANLSIGTDTPLAQTRAATFTHIKKIGLMAIRTENSLYTMSVGWSECTITFYDDANDSSSLDVATCGLPHQGNQLRINHDTGEVEEGAMVAEGPIRPLSTSSLLIIAPDAIGTRKWVRVTVTGTFYIQGTPLPPLSTSLILRTCVFTT